MIKTDFIPIDYDYFDFNGKNYARVIGRNSKGKRICLIDSCDIYLWAILDDKINDKKIKKLINKIGKITLDLKGRKTKVEKVELHNKNFLGRKVKALKIFATNYKDLHDIAGRLDFPEIQNRRGHDLGFTTHYIIEKKIEPLKWYDLSCEVLDDSRDFGGIGSSFDVDLCLKLNEAKKISLESNQNKEIQKFEPKVVAYDIETDEIKIGEGEILMVSIVSKEFKKVITWKKPKNPEENKKYSKLDYVEYVESEAALLKTFVSYIKKISPDILVGYFSDGFDLPYLRARADKLKVNLNIGLDGSRPKFFRGIVPTGKISGIVHIDLLKFIQTTYSQYMQSETLSLNDVSKEFLGDSKKEFSIEHSSKIHDQKWEEYYKYNLQDSVLTLGLFEKFWPDMIEFARIINEPLFEISRNGLSKQVEGYILHNLEKFNEIPEKRPTYDEIGERRRRDKVEGAFVLEPKPGLYENVAMFDFTSMHTSIIISMNTSKETLLKKKEKDYYESPEIEFKGNKTKFYFSKKQGFIPALLKEILEKRKQYKSEYKKDPNRITLARSNAFKLLSASVHGYIGFFGARYHSLESSASILAFVRKFNKDIIEKVKSNKYEVIYSDTDSIAFLRGKKSKDSVNKLLKKLNSELPGVMELELEGFFKRGIWVTKRTGTFGAKKKYALLGEDNKLKIRGFETVRRDWCTLARKVQNEIIKHVLEEGNEKKALEYLKKVIKKIKQREIPLEDLIIRTMLKKPLSEYKAISPHVIAARKMREKEIPVSSGNLIEYYIAQPQDGEVKKLVRERVKLPSEKGEYEIKYYLEKQILPAVENIFQVFGIDIKEVIENKGQKKLADF